MVMLTSFAAELGVDERTLRRAVSQGTVRATRRSPRKLELPLAERRYLRRSWPLLSTLRTALRTERNVRLAILFGSAAAGTDTPSSDVDLVVDLRDSSLDRVVELSAKLTALLNRRVDVVRLQDAEAEPLFLADVLAGGRVVVDREDGWRRISRRQASLQRTGRRRESRRVDAALEGIDRLLAP